MPHKAFAAACLYAVGGGPKERDLTMAALARAAKLPGADGSEFAEYRERIEYHLLKGRILSRDQHFVDVKGGDARKVAVLDVCFSRFGNPAGYVVHAGAPDFTTNFLIAVWPILVNSTLYALLCFPVFLPSRSSGMSPIPVDGRLRGPLLAASRGA